MPLYPTRSEQDIWAVAQVGQGTCHYQTFFVIVAPSVRTDVMLMKVPSFREAAHKASTTKLNPLIQLHLDLSIKFLS